MQPAKQEWSSGADYDRYIGRWSRRVAREFVNWLDMPASTCWLDVGCGTGALAGIIACDCFPQTVHGVDQSEAYLEMARASIGDLRVRFLPVDDVNQLPFHDDTYEAVVSGLVLNFLPDPLAAVQEMMRVARSEAVVAAYVWDYAGMMQFMRYFWDAVIELDPESAHLDEGRRFPLCEQGALDSLFSDAGLGNVEVRSIDVPTRFHDFYDFWQPFLGGQGPAGEYVQSLDRERRDHLRDRVRSLVPVQKDGSIRLIARAWAVRGYVPEE